MALHAQGVVLRRQDGFGGVRVVAVQAGHTGVAHAAKGNRGPVKVLIPLLAIGIKCAGDGGKGDAVMVIIIISRFERVGEGFVACVAGDARMHHPGTVALKRIERGGLAGRSLAVACGRLTMALNAADALLNPSGVKAVGGDVVIGFIAGHVALSAHGVPVHAATGPVAPFAGLSILLGEDVEPFAASGFVGELMGLPAPAGGGDERLPDRFVTENHQRDGFVVLRQTAGEGGEGSLVLGARQAVGEGVIGGFPRLKLRGVALGTSGRG